MSGETIALAALILTLGGLILAAHRRQAARLDALAEKLATNDFPHIEAKIEREAKTAREERTAMEARLGGRLDRMNDRLDRMESRATDGRREILAAIERTRGQGE